VDVSGTASLDAAVQAYRADPRVLYAEPDYVVRTTETPNDPNFSQQYGMSLIQAPAAWNVTHGSPAVKIAILDCGIYEAHPDLAGKVVAESDQVPPDENPFWNTQYYSGTDDLCNHGTHVAGIASANTNNGIGVAGVGYNTSLLNGKVLLENRDANHNLLPGGSGSVTGIANGIAWATANGANVINMSLGGGGPCPFTLQAALDDAWAHNIVTVVAAGNDGADESFFPADCNHVIPVASTDSTDARSSFSNYGSWVTVAAPGSSIYSTVNPEIPANGNALYGIKSGTSMATPHVAGLVGLLWATYWGTSAQSVVDRLTGTGDAHTDPTTDWSYRRINASAAVAGLPTITSLSPSTVLVGGAGFTLTINGQFFASGAQVLWNGTLRATTFLSSQQVTINVSAADIQTPQVFTVAVRNTDGHVSAVVTFAVTVPPAPQARSTNSAPPATPNVAPVARPRPAVPTGGSPAPAPIPVGR
jgi:thermitase